MAETKHRNHAEEIVREMSLDYEWATFFDKVNGIDQQRHCARIWRWFGVRGDQLSRLSLRR